MREKLKRMLKAVRGENLNLREIPTEANIFFKTSQLNIYNIIKEGNAIEKIKFIYAKLSIRLDILLSSTGRVLDA